MILIDFTTKASKYVTKENTKVETHPLCPFEHSFVYFVVKKKIRIKFIGIAR